VAETTGGGGGAATTGLGVTGALVVTGALSGADFTAAGATVVGRLTAAGGAATIFSAGGGVIAVGGGCRRGATGRTAAGAAAVSFRCVIAFSTSPGREILDRSILVLISSSPRAEREPDFPGDEERSAAERM
jgi:hypothetical protein